MKTVKTKSEILTDNRLKNGESVLRITRDTNSKVVTQEDMDYHHGMKTCLTPNNIKKIAKIDNRFWTIDDIKEVCPILLQSVVSNSCQNNKQNVVEYSSEKIDNEANSQKNTVVGSETYGLATVSVLIVSTLALLGLIFYLSTETEIFMYSSEILLGLGVSSLLTDAIIHKLPSVFSVDVDLMLIGKLSLMIFAFMVFYGIEVWVAYGELSVRLKEIAGDPKGIQVQSAVQNLVVSERNSENCRVTNQNHKKLLKYVWWEEELAHFLSS